VTDQAKVVGDPRRQPNLFNSLESGRSVKEEEYSAREQVLLDRLAEETAMVDDIIRRGLTEDRAEAIIWTDGYFAGRDAVVREQAEASVKQDPPVRTSGSAQSRRLSHNDPESSQI
jgi:hypothetical protein